MKAKLRYYQSWESLLFSCGAITLTGCCAIAILVTINPVNAQIVPDNTLEVNSSVAPGCTVCTIEGGTVRGSNLFHSFSEFSVPTGGEAIFNNATQIQNILTRVTGNSISNIDGLIRANGTANLFLINPNGIVFNSNASLNIGGSFIASTANSLNFSDRIKFSTVEPQTPPLLTINVPIGLQYASNPGSVEVQGASLQVNSGQTLALAGGNVSMNGGQLLALGGRVELAGVAGEGSINLVANGSSLGLNFPNSVLRTDVSITGNAEVNVRAGGGGNIGINARNLKMAGGSNLLAGINSGLGSVGSQAGDIEVNAQGAINLEDRSIISNQVLINAVGNGGDINITTGLLEVTNDSRVIASTSGRGNAGNVAIAARDTISFKMSYVFSSVTPEGIGNGGDINITTGSLFLTNGAELVAATFGKGDAGSVNITARDTISFDGVDSNGFPSGAFSNVAPGGVGTSDDINIITGSLFLTNGAQLVAATFGRGNAGSVNITARDTISFDGIGSNGFSSGAFSNVLQGGEGSSDDINITTSLLSVTNGAILRASNSKNGAAGNIRVDADSIYLDNKAKINAETNGGQGNINLLARDFLLLRRGSNITTNATGTATGGNITITTDNLVAVPKENSDISANAEDSFGGRVIVNASGIFGTQFRLQSTPLSDITASSARGSEFNGVVQLNTPDVNPSQGLTALPTNIIDTSQLIANSCIARSKRPEGKFVITGNGGLPAMPDDPSIAPYQTYQIPTVQSASISTLQENPTTSSKPHNPPKSAPLIEAQGWIYGSNGEVILTASAPTVAPHSSWLHLPTCSGS
ncbi:filamentous hemagglutinin N-terminal domain-containing protein [Nostoc sp. CHAB 5715]|uniref:two-partner secretion domain-containing protein n=1 Tax=Nostoc sp. CHAB 5715 TaxID=2780400 RepID=UPI001E2D19A6|nr:filamentous hemagglutinin N-terminal domain-containing protein [Nostoc sp. CHAB 5715]